jgi:hypothetical protein
MYNKEHFQKKFDEQRKEINRVFKGTDLLYTNLLLLDIYEYLVMLTSFLEKSMVRMGLPKVGTHPDENPKNPL